MHDSFDPADFLAYLRRHARFVAAAIASAAAVTSVACLIVPARYSATATLVIEPPVAQDPRAATAVTPVYLESLRTYEQFAGSDSLFAKACAEFHLSDAPGEPCSASFKRSVLRVTKLKDTKLMQLTVTLKDPVLAQRVVEYLTSETVALSTSLAREADRESAAEIDTRLTEARQQMQQARAEFDAIGAAGGEILLTEAIRGSSELKARANMELLRSQADQADLAVRNPQEAALEQARAGVLSGQVAALEKQLTVKSAELASLQARREQAQRTLKAAEDRVDTWARRANENAPAAMRSEQLRIVDPGVVPTQPSFPNLPLFTGAAIFAASLLSFAWLCLRYGMEQRRRRPELTDVASEYKVARGAHR